MYILLFFGFRLIFSQSLLSLNLIEDFLSHWNDLIHQKAAEANNGEVFFVSICAFKVGRLYICSRLIPHIV